MLGRPRGTARERAILRCYLLTTDYSAKETAFVFGISERRVNQVVREAMDEYGCRTRRELARLIGRRQQDEPSLPLWNWSTQRD